MYDAIIFNKVVSSDADITYNFFAMSQYIRPGTEIIIIEDDTSRLLHDIEQVNDSHNFWSLNALIYGPNYEYVRRNEIDHISNCKELYITPKLLDVYMTQELLYTKNGNIDFVFPFRTDNEFTFKRSYTRI
jgi:hypothetical protein